MDDKDKCSGCGDELNSVFYIDESSGQDEEYCEDCAPSDAEKQTLILG